MRKNYCSSVVGFGMLHSGLLAEPYGLENGVDHELERGPAIEWGQDEGIHGHPGTTVRSTVLWNGFVTQLLEGRNMHQQCSSCWVFCLEASRGMPISLYPATEGFCENRQWPNCNQRKHALEYFSFLC